MSSSGVIQTDPPEGSESFAFRAHSMESFVRVFNGKRLSLWVSHILHDWCNPDAIRYQLPFVLLCWNPTGTSIGSDLMTDLGRGTSLWFVLGLMCETRIELFLLSLITTSAFVPMRKIWNLDNHKVYVPQKVVKYHENLGISKIWDSCYYLTYHEAYNEYLVSGRWLPELRL